MSDLIARLKSGGTTQDRLDAIERIRTLEQALRDLILGYVSLLESARDRIVSLGGQCDDVYTMEMGDHNLRVAKKILEEK
jgi:hypothetical protein